MQVLPLITLSSRQPHSPLFRSTFEVLRIYWYIFRVSPIFNGHGQFNTRRKCQVVTTCSTTMPPSHCINFRPTDPKEKKIAILAVISFNDACPVPYSKSKVSEYFGVNERTTRKWCAEAAATMASQPAQQPETTPDSTEGRGIKRSRSEVGEAEVQPASISSGSHNGQKATRKAAQGQKKRKTNVKNEAVTPSPSPPEQLLTPPRRNASQRKKQRAADDSIGPFRFADESSDEYREV